MIYMAAYAGSLIFFGILDALWLWSMSSRIYRPVLGDILLSDMRIWPALTFYFLYPVGLTFFATSPALKSGLWTVAILNGALFGAFAYGTYDLTNYATLRNWTLQITLIDIVYGAVLSSVASLAGYWVARAVFGKSSI